MKRKSTVNRKSRKAHSAQPSLVEVVDKLMKANKELVEARRAALNLMEDALLSKEALSRSEEKLRQFNIRLEEQVAERTKELNESRQVLFEKNQQLNQTIAQLETFNYLASHDLQEPLRKIQTFVNLLNEKETDQHKVSKYLNSINDSAKRMSQLIDDLLDYSRLARPQEAFHQVDLNEILDRVKTDYEIVIREKNAQIENSPLPIIHAIPFQMHQLFANIVANALKFNEAEPHLKILARKVNGDRIAKYEGLDPEKKYAEITFADNGIGFDNEYKEKIFEVFQRLHGKAEYKGTGIGLSIVAKIVKNHRGVVEADGGNGHGASFVVYLPVN